MIGKERASSLVSGYEGGFVILCLFLKYLNIHLEDISILILINYVL